MFSVTSPPFQLFFNFMEITKQELEQIYNQHTNQEAAKKLKISMTTLHKYIKLAGIPFKGQGRMKKQNKIKIIG
jgi:predicted DNA-binding protein (UPF0251 family)